MPSHNATQTPTAVIVIKVIAAIAPSLIFQEVFRTHPKLAYCVGLVIGAVVWYYVPPRSNAKKLLALICCAILLGAIRLMAP